MVIAILQASSAIAGPMVEAGDLALRHDIQRLADAGLITGTATTWPMAWGPILADLANTDSLQISGDIADALARVRSRGHRATRAGTPLFRFEAALSDNPVRIRSFQDTPRGDAEVAAGMQWLGERFSFDLDVQAVDSEFDDQVWRLDHSMFAVLLGNWSLAASTKERWWGPSWDGSLILGNSARPFPAFAVDRMFTDAFASRWLHWLGPWDLSLLFGQLGDERAVPNTQFFGMRFNFRPLPSLEIGLSRTALWCGDGRPCSLGVFFDLLLGKDNLGDDGIDSDNEPGDQLAGFDVRWAPGFFGHSAALYGQFIGEDEAGGLPSKWLGQVGAEWAGFLFDRWSTRLFAELSATSCQFYESSESFNCAYNHGIYQTGYRYRGASIGHGADNDTRIVSVGLILVDADNLQWHALLRYGKLNRGGPPDEHNTITATPKELASIDVSHSRTLRFGAIELGAGYAELEDGVSGESSGDARFYLQWRSSP
ncbi:MAG TPA: capsule assembly Wzi family protein [Woeseiaceae bacterium]|nr:capsule assembly Wzi family protein [Woeseiaceae bacterium]